LRDRRRDWGSDGYHMNALDFETLHQLTSGKLGTALDMFAVSP
jgi:hypothetical protein